MEKATCFSKLSQGRKDKKRTKSAVSSRFSTRVLLKKNKKRAETAFFARV
jgi:hypothetical protein